MDEQTITKEIKKFSKYSGHIILPGKHVGKKAKIEIKEEEKEK